MIWNTRRFGSNDGRIVIYIRHRYRASGATTPGWAERSQYAYPPQVDAAVGTSAEHLFTKNKPSYWYGDSRYKPETVVRLS